jgi:hypothetical protein
VKINESECDYKRQRAPPVLLQAPRIMGQVSGKCLNLAIASGPYHPICFRISLLCFVFSGVLEFQCSLAIAEIFIIANIAEHD